MQAPPEQDRDLLITRGGSGALDARPPFAEVAGLGIGTQLPVVSSTSPGSSRSPSPVQRVGTPGPSSPLGRSYLEYDDLTARPTTSTRPTATQGLRMHGSKSKSKTAICHTVRHGSSS